jgi:hypothetical protein
MPPDDSNQSMINRYLQSSHHTKENTCKDAPEDSEEAVVHILIPLFIL